MDIETKIKEVFKNEGRVEIKKNSINVNLGGNVSDKEFQNVLVSINKLREISGYTFSTYNITSKDGKLRVICDYKRDERKYSFIHNIIPTKTLAENIEILASGDITGVVLKNPEWLLQNQGLFKQMGVDSWGEMSELVGNSLKEIEKHIVPEKFVGKMMSWGQGRKYLLYNVPSCPIDVPLVHKFLCWTTEEIISGAHVIAYPFKIKTVPVKAIDIIPEYI